MSLGNKKAYGKIINIGYGKAVQLKKIMKFIKQKIKKGTPNYGEINLRVDEPKTIYPNLYRAHKYLGWRAKINFTKGILKTINFYKKTNLV